MAAGRPRPASPAPAPRRSGSAGPRAGRRTPARRRPPTRCRVRRRPGRRGRPARRSRSRSGTRAGPAPTTKPSGSGTTGRRCSSQERVRPPAPVHRNAHGVRGPAGVAHRRAPSTTASMSPAPSTFEASGSTRASGSVSTARGALRVDDRRGLVDRLQRPVAVEAPDDADRHDRHRHGDRGAGDDGPATPDPLSALRDPGEVGELDVRLDVTAHGAQSRLIHVPASSAVSNSPASAVRPRLSRDFTVPVGDAERRGDLLHGQVPQVEQCHRLALLEGQRPQCLDHRHVVLRDAGYVGRGGQPRAQAPEHLRASPPSAEHVEGHGPQPGLRVVDAPEPFAGGHGARERLLHGVLRLDPVPATA